MLLEEAKIRLNSIDKNKAPIPKKNKGARGQWVEQQLGLDLGSDLLDFDDGEGKSFTKGQTIAVTMLQHCLPQIMDKSISYSQSKVGKKLERVLFVGFEKNTGIYADTRVFTVEEYAHLFYQLSEDYNYICEEIRTRFNNNMELSTINGPRDKNGKHKLLQIRTKASKKDDGTYTPLEYNGKRLKNKAMAFYLTRKFENLIF